MEALSLVATMTPLATLLGKSLTNVLFSLEEIERKVREMKEIKREEIIFLYLIVKKMYRKRLKNEKKGGGIQPKFFFSNS